MIIRIKVNSTFENRRYPGSGAPETYEVIVSSETNGMVTRYFTDVPGTTMGLTQVQTFIEGVKALAAITGDIVEGSPFL